MIQTQVKTTRFHNTLEPIREDEIDSFVFSLTKSMSSERSTPASLNPKNESVPTQLQQAESLLRQESLLCQTRGMHAKDTHSTLKQASPLSPRAHHLMALPLVVALKKDQILGHRRSGSLAHIDISSLNPVIPPPPTPEDGLSECDEDAYDVLDDGGVLEDGMVRMTMDSPPPLSFRSNSVCSESSTLVDSPTGSVCSTLTRVSCEKKRVRISRFTQVFYTWAKDEYDRTSDVPEPALNVHVE